MSNQLYSNFYEKYDEGSVTNTGLNIFQLSATQTVPAASTIICDFEVLDDDDGLANIESDKIIIQKAGLYTVNLDIDFTLVGDLRKKINGDIAITIKNNGDLLRTCVFALDSLERPSPGSVRQGSYCFTYIMDVGYELQTLATSYEGVSVLQLNSVQLYLNATLL